MQLMRLSLMALLVCNGYIYAQSPLDPQDEKDFLFLDTEEPDEASHESSEVPSIDEKQAVMPVEVDDENLEKIIQELENNE